MMVKLKQRLVHCIPLFNHYMSTQVSRQLRPTMITIRSLVSYKMILAANIGIPAVIHQCCSPTIIPPCPGTHHYTYALKLGEDQRSLDVISGDGNCFFRAISKELFGSQQFHGKMRQVLVSFISNNPTMLKALDFSNRFKQHCTKMSRNGTYATQVELQAMATFLQIPLYVFTQPSSAKEWQWTCFSPQAVTQSCYQYDPTLKNMPLPTPPEYHIEICHTNLNHYDRVIPLDFSDNPIEYLPPPKLPQNFWSAVIN